MAVCKKKKKNTLDYGAEINNEIKSMKKLLLTLVAGIAVLTAKAADYPYLTFETIDGAKASVSVESLNITISGATLTAGTESFQLSNLAKMYFSASEEVTTGIKTAKIDDGEILEVYNLQGRKVSEDQMQQGVYVIKTKCGTNKLIVK